jgi:hypothetical protein
MNKQDDSKVPFDTSRAPLGLRVASSLVADLGKLDDRFERHYLEIKSDIDPSKNELAKIAKYVLGSANRMPEKAATAFEGYGVMVIGVAPGRITGVPPIEILDIDKVVSAYIGPHGPHWDLIHVPVERSGNTVLVILVDPPQDGQDAFLCRKDGENLANGRIYIRADGETREARAPEVDLLLVRGKRTVTAEVGFEVDVLGYAYPVEIDGQRTVEAQITKTVQRLLQELPQPEPEPFPEPEVAPESEQAGAGAEIKTRRIGTAFDAPSVSALPEALKPSHAASAALSEMLKPHQSAMAKMASELASFKGSGGINSFMTSDPETRTEDQYRAAIQRWEGEFRGVWSEAVNTLAAYTLAAVSIRVRNKAKTFFSDLELKIHLEGEVDGLDWLDGNDGARLHRLNFPEPPRRWGPTQRSMLGRDFFSAPNYLPAMSFPSAYRSPLDWKNGGSVDVTLKVSKLRPRGEYFFEDPELILVLPFTRESHVKGTWQITASGHDEIYTGELQVEVGPPVDLTKPMRSLLTLDSV